MMRVLRPIKGFIYPMTWLRRRDDAARDVTARRATRASMTTRAVVSLAPRAARARRGDARGRRDGAVKARAMARWRDVDDADDDGPSSSRGMATRGKVAGAALALALAAMGASGMEARAEGFGSASSGVLYNPKRGVELENLLKLDEKARNRKASVLTRGNIDVLLQELNALQAVNEEALEQVDAELALLAAKNLEGQLSEYSETDAYANLSDQKKRLVDKRSNEASLQRRLKERKVIFGRLAAQGPVVVYGAAFVASIVSNATMHPLDTIKVRKISLRQKKSKEVGASVDLSVDESADEIRGYEPTWDEIVGEDGAMSLYDGLSSNLIKEGVPLALYLGLYEYAKDLLLQVDVMRPHPILIYLIAGGFGEFFASILRLPAEAVKNGTQIGMSIPEALETNVLSPAARKNLFKCWKVALLRDIPFGGIQLAVFEYLKLLLVVASIQALDPDAPLTEALFGAFGGMCGAFFTTPVDVVITRMINEVKSNADAGLPEDAPGTSPIDTALGVYSDSGLPGFFVGAKERVLYWGPAISIFLTVYCRIRQYYLPDIDISM